MTLRVSPVGISHNAVHEVVVHQAEARDWGSQVQVNDILLTHSPQGLAVTHPCQGIHYLLVARQLDAKSANTACLSVHTQAETQLQWLDC